MNGAREALVLELFRIFERLASAGLVLATYVRRFLSASSPNIHKYAPRQNLWQADLCGNSFK